MIIPSCIVTADDQSPIVEEEVDGMSSLANAYEGDYQEFFEGRPTRIDAEAGEGWDEVTE